METSLTPQEKTPASTLAIISFSLALSSLLIGPLGCIPAVICGHIARREDKTQGIALAGLIIGYIFLLIFILVLPALLFVSK